MFIFKKASHLDRKHYIAKHKHASVMVEKQVEVKVEPVKVVEEAPVVEPVEVKKPRAAKKPTQEPEVVEE